MLERKCGWMTDLQKISLEEQNVEEVFVIATSLLFTLDFGELG